jgi:hypothetical protein
MNDKDYMWRDEESNAKTYAEKMADEKTQDKFNFLFFGFISIVFFIGTIALLGVPA